MYIQVNIRVVGVYIQVNIKVVGVYIQVNIRVVGCVYTGQYKGGGVCIYRSI